jgi:hypothetical protein
LCGQLAPEAGPHVLDRQASSRQLFLKRVVWHVVLALDERCVELGLGYFEFHGRSLRDQDVLHESFR